MRLSPGCSCTISRRVSSTQKGPKGEAGVAEYAPMVLHFLLRYFVPWVGGNNHFPIKIPYRHNADRDTHLPKQQFCSIRPEERRFSCTALEMFPLKASGTSTWSPDAKQQGTTRLPS